MELVQPKLEEPKTMAIRWSPASNLPVRLYLFSGYLVSYCLILSCQLTPDGSMALA